MYRLLYSIIHVHVYYRPSYNTCIIIYSAEYLAIKCVGLIYNVLSLMIWTDLYTASGSLLLTGQLRNNFGPKVIKNNYNYNNGYEILSD